MVPLYRLAPPSETFIEAMQAPYVTGMLASAGQRVVEPKVRAITASASSQCPASTSKAPRAWRVGCIHPQGSS